MRKIKHIWRTLKYKFIYWYNFEIKKQYFLTAMFIGYYSKTYKEYRVSFINETDQIKKGILLGSNKYLCKANYGSEEGVRVFSDLAMEDIDGYGHLLAYLLNKNMSIYMLRIEGDDNENLKQKLRYIHSDPLAVISSAPIDVMKFFKNGQVQKDIIEIDRRFKCNGNHYFEFTIQPKSNITFSLYCKLTN